MDKKINNIGERTFAKVMKARGDKFIHQPHIKHIKLRPDFYCLNDDTYYEVIGTRQAYYAKKRKLLKAQKIGIKIKIVEPNGELFISNKRKQEIIHIDGIQVLSAKTKIKPQIKPQFKHQLKTHKRYTLNITVALKMQSLTGKPALSFVHPNKRKMFVLAYRERLYPI